MNEQVLRIVEGDPAAIVAQLKERGVRVLQRVGNRLIIEGEFTSKMASELSKVVQSEPVEPLAKVPAKIADEEIGLAAFRHRHSDAFRQSKRKRETEGETWNKVFERW